jgi:hypothetical protein
MFRCPQPGAGYLCKPLFTNDVARSGGRRIELDILCGCCGTALLDHRENLGGLNSKKLPITIKPRSLEKSSGIYALPIPHG